MKLWLTPSRRASSPGHCMRRWWRWWSRRLSQRPAPVDRTRDLQEVIEDAVDLGADVIRVEAKDLLSGLEQVARSRRATDLVLPFRETSGPRHVGGPPG